MEIREASFRGHPYKFACNPGVHHSWWTHEDEAEARNAFWNISEGDVVLDIGAAHGSYALAALAAGAAKCICWSPEKDGDEYIRYSIAANEWQDRTLILQTGLWSESGFLVAKEHALPPEFHKVYPMAWNTEWPPSAFPVVALDDCWPSLSHQMQINRVDYVKIDVEGAELEVIQGAKRTIREYRPHIFVENHLFKDGAIKDKFAALIQSLDCGYREIGTIPYHTISHSLYSAR